MLKLLQTYLGLFLLMEDIAGVFFVRGLGIWVDTEFFGGGGSYDFEGGC